MSRSLLPVVLEWTDSITRLCKEPGQYLPSSPYCPEQTRGVILHAKCFAHINLVSDTLSGDILNTLLQMKKQVAEGKWLNQGHLTKWWMLTIAACALIWSAKKAKDCRRGNSKWLMKSYIVLNLYYFKSLTLISFNCLRKDACEAGWSLSIIILNF